MSVQEKRRYEVVRFRYGVAVFGPIPVEDLLALGEAWKVQGHDTADSLLAGKLGASFVAGSVDELEKWRGALLASTSPTANRYDLKSDAIVDNGGEGTAASPHRYLVTLGLVEAVRRGKWNTGMLDALADWARERILQEASEAPRVPEGIRKIEEHLEELRAKTTRVRFRFGQTHFFNGRTYRDTEVLHCTKAEALILQRAGVGTILPD